MASHPGDESPGYMRTPLTGLKNLDAKTKPDNAEFRLLRGNPADVLDDNRRGNRDTIFVQEEGRLYRSGKGVAVMRGTKPAIMTTRRMARITKHGKHELVIRRAANHNAHVITPHGKVQAGRKGRKG